MQNNKNYGGDVENVVRIVRDAGGELKGRTRLQKVAFLLEITGLGDGFEFEYHRFGPYSEQLANAVSAAVILGTLSEEEFPTNWGGFYSVFKAHSQPMEQPSTTRFEMIHQATASDPIALELAATAAFLAADGELDPWFETERRKPEKAKLHLNEAKSLYLTLQALPTPRRLPSINSELKVKGDQMASDSTQP